jgi:SAM-dependent methyltransferase
MSSVPADSQRLGDAPSDDHLPLARSRQHLADGPPFASGPAPAVPAPTELYARALAGGPLYLRGEDGALRTLPVELWLGPPRGADERTLARACGPVLDVGCGPGRHVLALAERGIFALGVDIAPAAVQRARGRGATAVLGSVFDPIPNPTGWRTALLLDGNIGIGGRPMALLHRLSELLSPAGQILCELGPPSSDTRSELVALEDASGTRSSWFGWARVSVDDIATTAARAGMGVSEVWTDEERWFAVLIARRRQPRMPFGWRSAQR